MKTIKIFTLTAAAIALYLCCKPESRPSEDGPSTLEAPKGLSVSDISESTVTFKWTAVQGASAYNYKLMKGMTLIQSDHCENTQVTLEGLEAKTTYKFAVKSVNSKAESKYSDYIEVTTLESEVDPTPGPDPVIDIYEQMLIPACEEDGVVRAFPGAEGGGMYTSGGRGGKILHVTTLEDTNSEGSLRWAVGQKYARVIVFDVAGIIRLNSPLKISYGDCTIAGQTAPGDGICIADRYTQIDADNVIIRFIRFRLGDKGNGAGDSDDAIWGRYRKNVIIDHCSMSWSIDECASFYSNTDFTLQWCIIAESMKSCSIHTKGSHGYGGIWGGQNASFHHNILAHHDSRNPRFDHPHIYASHTAPAQRGTVDFRDNVVYNWGSNNSYGGEGYGAGKGTGINMVSNYYKPGPSSTDRKYFMDSYGVYANCSSCGTNVEDGYPLLYMSGNTHTKYSDISSNNAAGIYWHNGDGHANYGKTSSSAFAMSLSSGETAYTTTHTASDAMNAVCSFAGASLAKDKVDSRVCSDVKNGSGKIIDDTDMLVSLYGFCWPSYSATPEQKSIASKDSDSDGIPDYYETLFGLNPKDSSDAAAKTIDKKGRYSNFEMYLHYLVREIVSKGNASGSYTPLK